MKNLIIKTQKVVTHVLEVPEYFRIKDYQFFRITSDKTYVKVYYYGNDKEALESLDLSTYISVENLDRLYIYVRDQEIIPITKDEFREKFDSCLNFIDTL
jgi:hypothetical protein